MIFNDFSATGIRNNLALFAQSAEKIQNPDKTDLVGAELGIITACAGVKANISVMRASNAMQQSLIDIFA
jgi:hypothetical protein